MQNKRMLFRCACVVVASAALASNAFAEKTLTLSEAIALAKKQNPEIVIARKQVEAARGGRVEARAGYLPSVLSTGLLRKREQQEQSRLRPDDYEATLRATQNVYSGGAVRARNAIARLLEERRQLELVAITNRVTMDLRVAFQELLLNRSRIEVQEQAVGVMRDELKSQQERLAAGTVGELNVQRAEVSLANAQPELFEAQTRLQNSYLRIHELCGLTSDASNVTLAFQAAGKLEYQPFHPDQNECLAYASTSRPEVRAAEIDVQVEEQQMIIDRSELRPRVDVFSGYEVYSERDPEVGREFNHGYVVGLNASWHIFDGFATRGRLQATRARREAAEQALRAAQLSVASDVRSAFFDLQQADRVLESETRNVESANESLEAARANLTAGLGTQLEVLQAAADVTRTRTARLSAVYLHNAALARLARATARDPEELGFKPKVAGGAEAKRQTQLLNIAQPPSGLTNR